MSACARDVGNGIHITQYTKIRQNKHYGGKELQIFENALAGHFHPNLFDLEELV